MALVPGLVNAHTHAAMTLFRGYADDLPLMEWLTEHIWPVEKQIDDEDVYWGTRLACVEMIRTGTTCFWDMYWHAHATARAVEDAGVRAVTGGAADRRRRPGEVRARLRRRRAQPRRRSPRPAASSRGPASRRTRSTRCPSARCAGSPSARSELEVPVQIHLSETEDEVNGSLDQHGERPAFYLDRVGMLGPHTVLAHGCWLDRAELELIAERGATVVTNPVANLKLAVGRRLPLRRRPPGRAWSSGWAPTARARTTRSTCSPRREGVRAAAEERGARPRGGHGVGDAGDRDRAALRRCSAAAGSSVGAPADFLLVRSDDPELSLGRARRRARLRGVGAIVDTTVVAGRVLMRGGVVDGRRPRSSRRRASARQRLGLTGPAGLTEAAI